MTAVHPSGQQIEDQIATQTIILGEDIEMRLRSAVQSGSFNVDHDRCGVDLLDGFDGTDDALRHLEEDTKIAALASEIRWPVASPATHEGGHQRLVVRRIP